MSPSHAIARLRREAAAARARADTLQEELRLAEATEKRAAIVDALALYPGTTHGRAKALASDLTNYAGNAWSRDRDAGGPPASASELRRAWFRILASREGETIGWRRISDLAEVCNPELSTLQAPLSESPRRSKSGNGK